jgi:hypothetical protein
MLTEMAVWKKSHCDILIVMMEVHLLLKTLGMCSLFGLCHLYTVLFLIFSCNDILFMFQVVGLPQPVTSIGTSSCIYIKCHVFWGVIRQTQFYYFGQVQVILIFCCAYHLFAVIVYMVVVLFDFRLQ